MKKTAIFLGMGFLIVCLFISCEKQAEQYEKGKAKAWQLETKINFPAMYAAQAGFKALNLRFAKSFDEMGFSLAGKNIHYSYFMGEDSIKGNLGPEKLPEGLSNPVPTKEAFVIWAVANIDSDPDLDIWKTDQNRNVQHIKSDLASFNP